MKRSELAAALRASAKAGDAEAALALPTIEGRLASRMTCANPAKGHSNDAGNRAD